MYRRRQLQLNIHGSWEDVLALFLAPNKKIAKKDM